jgi:ABC-type nitrate/sulfonate/bicarbonate transport system substrate-binding protein
MKSIVFGLSALSALLVLTRSAPAQTSKLPQLKVAVSTATPHNTPLWVAKDKKLFEKYGVDVQMIFVMGGALVSQMLAAGEIQVAANAPAALVSLIAGGADIAMFLGISNTSPFTLMSQPTIKAAADLRGKRLGTARFGGSSHISALIALDHLGLEPKRDKILLMQTGLDPERMAALEQKGLDANAAAACHQNDDQQGVYSTSKPEWSKDPVPEYRAGVTQRSYGGQSKTL